jgi:predicted nuclease with TOPRIM domain
MYPVKRSRFSPYLRTVGEYAHVVEERIPTFSKTLDRYFDAYFEEIITEWELLTEYELTDLADRVESVTRDIDQLYQEKSRIEERTAVLRKEIETLEGGENQ